MEEKQDKKLSVKRVKKERADHCRSALLLSFDSLSLNNC